MKFIDKLRALTENEKKVVIFTIVIGVALILGFFWVKSAAQNISKLQSVNLPKIELPEEAKGALDNLANLKNQAVDTANQANQAIADANQTADWKTYTNAEYGFEVKYPKDVVIEQNGNIIAVHDKRQELQFDWNMIFYKNDKKINLEDWINFQFDSFAKGSDKDCKIVSADKYGSRVNIENAYTVLIDAPSYGASCGHVGYYTISPDKLTIMGFDSVQASPELYQDMLSTFTFTNTTN